MYPCGGACPDEGRVVQKITSLASTGYDIAT